MSTKAAALAGFTLLVTLTCIGLQGYYAQPRCKGGCGDGVAEICQKTAPALKTETMSCDWRTATSVVGLLALVITLVFVALVFLAIRGKDFAKHIKITGIVIAPLILATIGLMIADIVKGHDYVKDSGINGTSQGSYIANLVLTFLATILVGYITFAGVGDKNSGINSPKVSSR